MAICKNCGAETEGKNFYCSKKCGYNYRNKVKKEMKKGNMKPRKRIKPMSEIERINQLAREEGVSYGQYVALHL